MIKYDHVYRKKISEFSFGELDETLLKELFKDGRIISRFLERSLENWFPELEFVDGIGYDHIHKKTQQKFDCKIFGKYGAKLMPSHMIGAGRQLDMPKAHKHAKKIDYIIVDILSFPNLFVIFKKGGDISTAYKSLVVPVKQRKELFNGLVHS